MRYFPVFLSVAGRRIVVAGGGDEAIAKLRLLMKTEADIAVFAPQPAPEIIGWAEAGRLTVLHRAVTARDIIGAALVYVAMENRAEVKRVAAMAQAEGVSVNVVDDLKLSDFLSPAIVDRDPVTVAIGTEGAAPVLARAIKAEMEEQLPPDLGRLTRIGHAFRPAARALPQGRRRRDFWAEWYATAGPDALDGGRDPELAIKALLAHHLAAEPEPGRVIFVGAGPGAPDLLTLRARRVLDNADVVIHDRLVPDPILELARREALIIPVGKEGFGPSTKQESINELIVDHARRGAVVVRLKSGDPAIFGRLDEEIDAADAAGVEWSVVPGITAASAAVASLGQSLTRRGRNSAAHLITGQDVDGLAEHDWRALAGAGEVTALYMGKSAARFVQGRLLTYGADPEMPVGVVENASRPDQRIFDTSLARLPDDLAAAGLSGPVVIFLGLASRGAIAREREIAL